MATVLYAAAVISFRERFSRPPGILGSLLLSRSSQGRIQFSPSMDEGGHGRPLSMSWVRVSHSRPTPFLANNASPYLGFRRSLCERARLVGAPGLRISAWSFFVPWCPFGGSSGTQNLFGSRSRAQELMQ